MYGVWESSADGADPELPPFDIPMQGLGLFACRREAWPRFNPAFRGFGGEEGYIHENFDAQAAGRSASVSAMDASLSPAIGNSLCEYLGRPGPELLDWLSRAWMGYRADRRALHGIPWKRRWCANGRGHGKGISGFQDQYPHGTDQVSARGTRVQAENIRCSRDGSVCQFSGVTWPRAPSRYCCHLREIGRHQFAVRLYITAPTSHRRLLDLLPVLPCAYPLRCWVPYPSDRCRRSGLRVLFQRAIRLLRSAVSRDDPCRRDGCRSARPSNNSSEISKMPQTDWAFAHIGCCPARPAGRRFPRDVIADVIQAILQVPGKIKVVVVPPVD